MTAGRREVIAHRLAAQHLTTRLPARSRFDAAFCGLQDSAPRSAVLSLHARAFGVRPDDWADPAFVQVWGPRGAVYVVPAADVAVFTLALSVGSSPAVPDLGPDPVRKRDAACGGLDLLMRASTTGRVRIRWDGRDTLVWTTDAPRADPLDARAELLRRFLLTYGTATPSGFAKWSGLSVGEIRPVWEQVSFPELIDGPVSGVRLLPPGDPYLLAPDRELLVPDPARRKAVWPLGTVQPGAMLVDGELLGTWRRRAHQVTVSTFASVPAEVREAAEEEARGFPLALDRDVTLRWGTIAG